jgi:Raf kinase inhibitor-like YbhB/YbcL family protein
MFNRFTSLFVGSLLLGSVACGDDTSSSGSGGGGGSSATTTSTGDGGSGTTTSTATTTTTSSAGGGGEGGEGGMAAFALTSPAFGEGETIPTANVCTSGGGSNLSPVLSWTAGPSGTQSYAVVMRDLDFQSGFLHWVIWDIPASTMTLPEGIENVYQPSAPAGSKQAPFNQSLVGYLGPCSPNSVNTYQFTVYAIGSATLSGLSQSSSKQEAAAAIEAAAIASASLSGES